MVLNTKIAFRVFVATLIVIFLILVYFVFFDSKSEIPLAEKIFENFGFKSDEFNDNPAVPLPDGSNYGGGFGGGSSGDGESVVLRFCTFDAYHQITSEVPCRCGFSGVCYELGSTCDATFNNGEGYCS